jgi:hypothetical protein
MNSHLGILTDMQHLGLSQRVAPSLTILALLWLAIFGPGLFHPPLMDDADAAHADAG